MRSKFLVAITGASGAPYAVAFLRLLKEKEIPVDLIVSETGEKVVEHETGLSLKDLRLFAEDLFLAREIVAPPASGSAGYKAMVIIPCTMGTLSAVAHGAARNLIHRAADVMLKERRPLVLVVRETPFNLIHLRNMLQAAEAGAVIYPAMPAFYHCPKSLEEMVTFFVQRLVSFLGIDMPEMKRWGSGSYHTN